MSTEYLPSLTYRKSGKPARNWLQGWASEKGGSQVSVCVSRLTPRATQTKFRVSHGMGFPG